MKSFPISPRNVHENFFLKIGAVKAKDNSTGDPKGGICKPTSATPSQLGIWVRMKSLTTMFKLSIGSVCMR